MNSSHSIPFLSISSERRLLFYEKSPEAHQFSDENPGQKDRQINSQDLEDLDAVMRDRKEAEKRVDRILKEMENNEQREERVSARLRGKEKRFEQRLERKFYKKPDLIKGLILEQINDGLIDRKTAKEVLKMNPADAHRWLVAKRNVEENIPVALEKGFITHQEADDYRQFSNPEVVWELLQWEYRVAKAINAFFLLGQINEDQAEALASMHWQKAREWMQKWPSEREVIPNRLTKIEFETRMNGKIKEVLSRYEKMSPAELRRIVKDSNDLHNRVLHELHDFMTSIRLQEGEEMAVSQRIEGIELSSYGPRISWILDAWSSRVFSRRLDRSRKA